ncbi:MAG: GldG family protein [Gammaproteobacteria bacterium]
MSVPDAPTWRERLRGPFRRLGWGLLIVTVTAVLVATADRHLHVVDVSRDARSSLDAKSLEVLRLLDGPLTVTAVLPRDHAVAPAIEAFFARYRRAYPALTLAFLDPRIELDAARRLGANLGEIVIGYQGRREHLTRLDESTVTNSLARLLRGAERYVTVLTANGERRSGSDANRDLSRFAAHLGERGLALREFAFGRVEAIPGNTVVLVIASPRSAYSLHELAAIERYVATGGNLLWLAEPDQPPGLDALARSLGVEILPGTVVDPLGLTRLGNPAYAVAVSHPEHAVFEGFDQTLAFPYAAALAATPNAAWEATTLAHTEAEAWTETGPFEGNVGYDGGDEIQGELVLALALTRARADGSRQRVAVVGDGDAFSNIYVDNLGNREFGRRLVEWLAEDDALIELHVEPVPDALLDLDMWARMAIFVFFGLALPAFLLANGALIAWRRRHA